MLYAMLSAKLPDSSEAGLFKCPSLRPTGYSDPDADEDQEDRLPPNLSYIGAPFQPLHWWYEGFQAQSIATVLVHSRMVANGMQILGLVRQQAENQELRREVCKEFKDGCIAPRLIVIKGDPIIDLAVAYCVHLEVESEWIISHPCTLFALRFKRTNEFAINAYFSPEPQTVLTTKNWIGDADIVCENNSGELPLSILKKKFKVADGWQVSLTQVKRLGYVSDVYTNLRENTVLRIASKEREIKVTPIIMFSPQNTREQSQFRPISSIEYQYYVTKLHERLQPELECRDARF
jgi:hypothetical protein